MFRETLFHPWNKDGKERAGSRGVVARGGRKTGGRGRLFARLGIGAPDYCSTDEIATELGFVPAGTGVPTAVSAPVVALIE